MHSPRSRTFCLLVLAAICSLPEATATAASRRLTYREAVGIAAERNPDVRSAAATVDAAVAKAKSAWGALLPQIQVQGGIMYWNDTLKSNFFDSSGVTPPPPPETAFEQWLMTSLLSTFTQSIVIREQLTGQLALQASQPLTSFFPLYQVFQMQRRAEDAARFDAHTTRDQVVKQAKVNYLELLRVMNLEQIARTAVEQVDAHRKVADSFYRAGVVGREQVLKAEVQLAQSREQVIRATAGVALLRSVLATSLGLDPAQEIEPVDEFKDPPPRVQLTMEEAGKLARSRRPELAAVRSHIQQAEAGRRAAIGQMLPLINVVGNYTRAEGMGAFAEKDTACIGAVMSWNVWDTGSNYHKVQEAAAMKRTAEIGLEKASDLIYVDAKRAYLDLRSAEETLAVSRTAVSEAEENFRLEKSRFAASASTSTDVLDAQLALTRARANFTNALYGVYEAMAAVERAIGVDDLLAPRR